jgi:hypothetical protein
MKLGQVSKAGRRWRKEKPRIDEVRQSLGDGSRRTRRRRGRASGARANSPGIRRVP